MDRLISIIIAFFLSTIFINMFKTDVGQFQMMAFGMLSGGCILQYLSIRMNDITFWFIVMVSGSALTSTFTWLIANLIVLAYLMVEAGIIQIKSK